MSNKGVGNCTDRMRTLNLSNPNSFSVSRKLFELINGYENLASKAVVIGIEGEMNTSTDVVALMDRILPITGTQRAALPIVPPNLHLTHVSVYQM